MVTQQFVSPPAKLPFVVSTKAGNIIEKTLKGAVVLACSVSKVRHGALLLATIHIRRSPTRCERWALLL
jgi:hypothetical protein